MSIATAPRAFRLAIVLILAVASVAAAWTVNEDEPRSDESSAVASATAQLASPDGPVGIYSSTPSGYILNEVYHDVTISFCNTEGMTSHSITSPNGEVIEDAAASCPWGQGGFAYFVRWADAFSNPLDIGENYIYVQHCDEFYSCTNQTIIIKYYPLLDSLQWFADEMAQVEVTKYDTVRFRVRDIHSALSYNYDSVAAICHTGLTSCTIIGDDNIVLSPFSRDTITISFRADSVGPRAITMRFCRSGPVCLYRSQTIAVTPPTPVERAVTVTANTATTNKGGGTSFSLGFAVQNTGTKLTKYRIEVACDASIIASGCSAYDTLTLAASASSTVTLSSLVATNPGTFTTGSVRVTAYAGAARATGETAVTVGPTGGIGDTTSISLTTAGLNPVGSVSRDQCLMLAAGDAAGVECGDLRLAHALPAMHTGAKTRGAALIYLSRHAEGVPLLHANVRSLHGDPDSVRITLVINSDTVKRTFAWPSSCNNQYCRITLPVKPSTGALATGWYRYSMQASMTIGGVSKFSAIDTGSVAVVNRSASPFGRGWWVQGHEQVIHLTDTTRKMWIGGDGSTRIYKRASIGSNTVYISEYAVSREDTLQRHGTDDWRRRLPNGAYVRFNSTGAQTHTVSAMGDTTRWTYDGSGTLERISLPRVSSSVNPHYQFHYTGSAPNRTLDSVRTRSDTVNASRTTKLTRTGFHVARFTDADASQVNFVVDTTTGRVSKRLSRLNDTTIFSYDAVGGVSKTRLWMGRTGDSDITQELCPAETRSLVQCTWGPATAAGGVPVPNVVTRVDGPRTGLIDVMTFYINRFGGPDTLQAPDGSVTRIERSNTFPVLATKVTGPGGRYTRAWYNNRGLVDSMSAPGPDTVRAVTRIKWNSVWMLPDTIRPPLGPYQRFWNNSGIAVVDSQQTGTSASTRVRFTYSPIGGGSWRLTEAVQPGLQESYSYDGTLGNIYRVQANDVITRVFRDRWGMDSVVQDRDDTSRVRTTYYRNVLGRVDSTRARSRASSYVLARSSTSDTIHHATQIVRNVYDAEGNITSVARADSASAYSSTASQSQWTYDAARRLRSRLEPSGADSTFYDAAGNAIRTKNARGQSIYQVFDEMGRLVARVLPEVTYNREHCVACNSNPYVNDPVYFPFFPSILPGYMQSDDVVIPGDVEWFVFDSLGQMSQANNRDARISRTYHSNGALKADTLRVRPYDPTETLHTNPYTMHVYGQQYSYDLLGRRTQRTDSDGRLQTYTYNDTLGTLVSTKDRFSAGDSLTFNFTWDSAGQLRTIQLPSRYTETRNYDANGRQVSRTAGEFTDTAAYDERGKQLYRATTTATPLMSDTSRMSYDNFGAVRGMERIRHGGEHNIFADEFRLDALGNQVSSDANRGWNNGRNNAVKSYSGERLMWTGTSPLPLLRDPVLSTNPLIKNIDTTYFSYDASGNQTASNQVVWEYSHHDSGTDYWSDPTQGGDRTRSYYDANNRLKHFERNTRAHDPIQTVQEYRYDALGRRVLTRTRCTDDGPDCVSGVERFFWDGDQLAVEHRMRALFNASAATLDSLSSTGDFVGTVRYTHALGIDQPLVVRKHGAPAPFIPIRTGRGGFEGGMWTDDGTAMEDFHWPERYNGLNLGGDTRLAAATALSWYGSLLENKTDASGLVYMRNRYYDPTSGRFTQRDPIGLAGGINQYGYAGGDPVNHSDPFGLCKEADANCRALVRMLREQSGAAFAGAAATFDAYQGGNVYFYAESQLNPLTPRGSLDGWVNQKTGDVGIVGERSREDFLITAVHEAWHLENPKAGNTHPQELVDLVYEAYMQLSPEERQRATQTANWLYENTNGERGEPKAKEKKP